MPRQWRAVLGEASFLFFHFRLVDMPASFQKRVAGALFVLAEARPIAIVEFFDDLERPPPGQDIAAHELFFDLLGDFGMPAALECFDGRTQFGVGGADQLVELVEVPTSTLDRFERFGQLPHGSDRTVVRARRPAVPWRRLVRRVGSAVVARCAQVQVVGVHEASLRTASGSPLVQSLELQILGILTGGLVSRVTLVKY